MTVLAALYLYMQPHHPSFEGEAHNLVSNIIFLDHFPTKVYFFVRHICTRPLARPLYYIGQRKHQDGGKQNGGSPCNLKMTRFAEIVRVADR